MHTQRELFQLYLLVCFWCRFSPSPSPGLGMHVTRSGTWCAQFSLAREATHFSFLFSKTAFSMFFYELTHLKPLLIFFLFFIALNRAKLPSIRTRDPHGTARSQRVCNNSNKFNLQPFSFFSLLFLIYIKAEKQARNYPWKTRFKYHNRPLLLEILRTTRYVKKKTLKLGHCKC